MGRDFAERQRPDAVGPQAPKQEKQTQEKTGVTNPVDDKGLFPGAGLFVVRIPKANEQIGAQPDAFPAHEEQQDIIAQHQQQHGGGKEVEIGKIAHHIVVVGHIADGIDVDEKADPGDDHDHGAGQGIDPQRNINL